MGVWVFMLTSMRNKNGRETVALGCSFICRCRQLTAAVAAGWEGGWMAYKCRVGYSLMANNG